MSPMIPKVIEIFLLCLRVWCPKYYSNGVYRKGLYKYIWILRKKWWMGVGGFSKVVATFNHIGGSINLIMSEYSNLFEFRVMWCICWAHFMCQYELWPTSVSHTFSFLNSSWCLAGGKHYQKITIPILRLVLQNFAIPGYFPYILFYCYL